MTWAAKRKAEEDSAMKRSIPRTRFEGRQGDTAAHESACGAPLRHADGS